MKRKSIKATRVYNKKGEEKRLSIRELLPYGFDQTWLAIDEK